MAEKLAEIKGLSYGMAVILFTDLTKLITLLKTLMRKTHQIFSNPGFPPIVVVFTYCSGVAVAGKAKLKTTDIEHFTFSEVLGNF